MPKLAALAAFAALWMTAIAVFFSLRPAQAHVRGHIVVAGSAAEPSRFVPVLREGDTVPDIALVDQRGDPVILSHFRGMSLVLSFVYTRCTDGDMCPLVSAKFSRVARGLGHQRIHLMEVTLDPAYDTPHVLARYGAAYGADARTWTLATGVPAAVSELAARAGVVSTSTPRGIVHSDVVIVLDAAGRLYKIIDGNTWTPNDLLAAAGASLGDRPTPLAAFSLWLRSGVAAVCGGASGVSTGAALAIFVAVLAGVALGLKHLAAPRSRRRRSGERPSDRPGLG